MYTYGIINFLMWPLVIWLSYKLSFWAVKKLENKWK